jgi:hypothetical protein
MTPSRTAKLWQRSSPTEVLAEAIRALEHSNRLIAAEVHSLSERLPNSP